jgi:hypothetical protein
LKLEAQSSEGVWNTTVLYIPAHATTDEIAVVARRETSSFSYFFKSACQS